MTEARGDWALEARKICFDYPGGIAALAGVDFHAQPGEFVAVLGANGSGKTTLLKVLMRLLVPQQGAVTIGQEDLSRLRPAELYRRIGMVFQNPTDQLFAPTVEQDVAFGPKNLGLDDSEVSTRVEGALAAVDAVEFRTRPVHHLSYGQQKRVCLAGVLAMRPSILLLDEPTAGLDPVGETQMVELLLRLNRQQGTTMIFCTHAVDLLPVLADRVCVLRRGTVWQEGSPDEVLVDPEGAAAAGLRVPLVAQLFHDLARCHGLSVPRVPLTIAQARERILELLVAARTSQPPQGVVP